MNSKDEIISAIAKKWHCVPLKLADEHIDCVLIGKGNDGVDTKRISFLHVFPAGDKLGDKVRMSMGTFKTGILSGKALGIPLCVVAMTDAGVFFSMIDNKSDVIDGDFITIDSDVPHVEIYGWKFNKLEI